MERALLIAWLLFGNLMITMAQQEVRGRVVDSGKQPINGANIIGTDGRTLALTDTSGYFSLTEPLPVKITVSHVSFVDSEIEILAGQTGLLEIVLETNETLIEEVEISTGFQQIPRERATGAFSHIDNETFNEQISTDVLSRLEAVANGLNIERVATTGSDMGIRIRGLSTLSVGAIRDPLVILDNFPYEGDLNNLNPNDVESVTLLKDAAAASIWGARAGNGVIVITTKRGKQNQPLRIDFNGNMTIGSKPDLGYYQQMSGADFIEMERFLFERNHRFSDTAAISRPPFSPAYEIMFRQRRGEISEIQANTMLTELAQSDVRGQYLEYMYEPSVNQQYAVSLQGGNDNTAWYLSTGYDRNKNTLGGIDNRYNINFRNTYTPFKSLQLHVGLMHTQGQSVNGRTGYSISTIPYMRIADEHGNPVPVIRDYRQLFLDTLGGGRLLDWNYYPLTDDGHIDNRVELSHTLINFGLNQKISDWLSLDVKYQYGRQHSHSDVRQGEGSYVNRNLINLYSQISPVSDDIDYIIPRGTILDQTRNYLESQNLRGQINLNEAWRLHEVTALIGGEASHSNTVDNVNRTYGYNSDILTFSQVDYLTRYPTLITGAANLIPQNQSFANQTRRFISSFANVAYTYADRYTATLSGRSDASNQFGVNFNDRWNLLWSAGLSWETSKEEFYKSQIIPYLRLRATYGFSGNTDLSRSGVTVIQYSGTSPFLNTPISFVSQNGNTELGWEKVKMVNVAVDFQLKGGRLAGNIDFFFKKGTDLFGPDPLDYTTGISDPLFRNISSMKGRGVDVELKSVNWEGIVRWTSNFNFSFYTDRVVKYYRSNMNMSAFVTSNMSAMSLVEGERPYSLYSYRWGGLDPETGDPIGFIDREPSKLYSSIIGSGSTMEDIVNHGSRVPLFHGSLGNTFSYKNFGVNVRILYKLGYFVRSEGLRYGSLFGVLGGASHSEYGSRWIEPGDELNTYIPSMIYPNPSGRDNFYNLSEIRVKRGDHVRLQYVALHYDLNSGSAGKMPFRKLRIYFNASNLGIIWRAHKDGLDPEYGSWSLPPESRYSFGLLINF